MVERERPDLLVRPDAPCPHCGMVHPNIPAERCILRPGMYDEALDALSQPVRDRAAETAATAPEAPGRVRTRSRRKRGSGVNRALTPRTPRETADVGAGIARMIRGLSRRAEGGDLEGLRQLRRLEAMAALESLRAAHALNAACGYSWAEIGLAVGMTRQAAHRRWGG